MQVIYHSEAEAELIEAAEFYESRLRGLGVDFLTTVDSAVSVIQTHPERFPVVEGDIRRCRLSRFPYCIYYRREDESVRILVVKHHSRHPNYWKGRN